MHGTGEGVFGLDVGRHLAPGLEVLVGNLLAILIPVRRVAVQRIGLVVVQIQRVVSALAATRRVDKSRVAGRRGIVRAMLAGLQVVEDLLVMLVAVALLGNETRGGLIAEGLIARCLLQRDVL